MYTNALPGIRGGHGQSASVVTDWHAERVASANAVLRDDIVRSGDLGARSRATARRAGGHRGPDRARAECAEVEIDRASGPQLDPGQSS